MIHVCSTTGINATIVSRVFRRRTSRGGLTTQYRCYRRRVRRSLTHLQPHQGPLKVLRVRKTERNGPGEWVTQITYEVGSALLSCSISRRQWYGNHSPRKIWGGYRRAEIQAGARQQFSGQKGALVCFERGLLGCSNVT